MESLDTRLPSTITQALKIDELLHSLIDACNNHDIHKFNQVIFTHQGTSNKSNHALVMEATKPLSKGEEWIALADWNEFLGISKKLFENLFLDLYASLDAEWGSQYFKGMKPAPIFLWITPRINEDWDIQNGLKPSKNQIYRPVRRLLEFSYAIVHTHYRKKWTSSPVGRTELGKKMGIGDADIGNYFDGTCKLKITAYNAYWERLCEHFSGTLDKTDYPRCPVPLGIMAITLQKNLIQNTSENKLKSFILIDEDDYKSRWQRHRFNGSDQSPSVYMDWPLWLSNQSVSSDQIRSSKSTGH